MVADAFGELSEAAGALADAVAREDARTLEDLRAQPEPPRTRTQGAA
jgi:hypothetical protein